MKKLLFIAFVMLGMNALHAQNAACTKRLEEAELAFDQGRLQDVLDLLNRKNKSVRQCYSTFTRDETIRALKLLTKAHIFYDNIEEAENALHDLLIADKEHQLAKDDPAELHFLYSQFQSEPIFRIAFRAGVNKSLPKVIQSFSSAQSGEKRYNQQGNETGLGIGFSAEALIERYIKDGIEVALGPQLRFAAYEVEGDVVSDGAFSYVVTNRSTMLRIPVLGRYTFGYDRKNAEGFRESRSFYVFGGASFDLMLDAKYVSTSRSGGTAFTLNNNNSLTELDQVARTNASVFLGAGMKLRIGQAKVDFITFELRFDNSLFNYINPDNRFANLDVNRGDISHVEDDLTLNTVSFSVGYTRSFYNPIKRKQYR